MEKERKTTYERPTLTLVGPFAITGLGFFRGPERILFLRFSL
ncbi:MAG TPA: keywimysin-related RiPP [Acidimicrobiales bacterium]|nr:keywimysin-related RiPP [Acidimicrobiales bacterium]